MKKETSALVWGGALCLTLFSTQVLATKSDQCDLVIVSGAGEMTLIGGVIPAFVGTDEFRVVTADGLGAPVSVDFTAAQLGVVETAEDSVTVITSHAYSGTRKSSIRFTTMDELKLFPLGPDPTCQTNDCGITFRLKLEKGSGKYNCGEIVSGFTEDPTAPFASTTTAGNPPTVNINAVGKLCKCSGNR